MRIPLAYKLRKIADFILRDDTPTEEEIHERRGRKKGQVPETGVVPVPTVKVQEEGPGVVPAPKIKPSRALPEHKKKWNEENSAEEMKKYMRDYRAEGKVYETDSPKSKYVRKPQ